MRKIQHLIILAGLIGLQAANANAPAVNGPGSVPLQFERRCASDLFKDGRILQPDEACALYSESQKKFEADGSKNPNLRFDLSRLEPDPSTTVIDATKVDKWVWRPWQDPTADVIGYKQTDSSGGFYDDLKAMSIKDEGDVVDYVSSTETGLGRLAIVVSKVNDKGQTKYFQLRMDLKGHNYLLRKTLLRKVGYQVPYMDRLKTVKVKFSNEDDLFKFVQELYKKTFVEPSRWILNPYVDLLIEETQNSEESDKIDELTKNIREGLELELQDIIVLDGMMDKTFNIGRGRFSSEQIQGRRALNALLVPFSLTDVPESVNIFDWSMCDQFNNQLYLNYEYANNPDGESIAFAPAYEDARWITRKILNLTRRDWQETVASAKVPPEVGAVLVEKLISRRNCLREKLHLDKESGHVDAYAENSVELPVTYKIDAGERLKGGSLVNRPKAAQDQKKDQSTPNIDFNSKGVESFWKGYARNFSGIEPDSPQSREELLGYGKSQLIYNLIRNAVSRFNEELPKTDIAYKEFDRDLTLSVWQFGQFIKTKEIPKIPRKIWSTKFYNLFAYPDRDVIAGNYMGAENQVQIADSLTLGVDLGFHFKGEGLPAKMGLSGKAKLNMLKSWVHIKPLSSMKLGLAEPYSNIIVPYFEYKAGRPLEFLLGMEDKLQKIKDGLAKVAKTTEEISDKLSSETDETKKKSLEAELAALTAKKKALTEDRKKWSSDFPAKVSEFNSIFGPNESVIVSTSIGPDISVMLTKGISEIAALYAQARARFVDVNRIQIMRKGSNKLQIFFDPTLYKDWAFALGLAAKGSPLMQFDWSFKSGSTITSFFEYNIDATVNKQTGELNNKDFFKNIRMLSAALRGTKMKYFEKTSKPIVIEHDFKNKNFGISLLAHRYQSENTADKLKVKTLIDVPTLDKSGRQEFDSEGKLKTNKEYRESNYIRMTDGSRKGTDYQSLIVNITAGLLREKYPKIVLNFASSGNPADTLGGRAISRHVVVESEVVGSRLRLDNLLASIRYTWKGWSISKDGAEKTIDELKTMFGSNLIKKPDLTTTKKIQFYNLAMNISLYQEAINNLMSASDKQIDDIFAEYFTGIQQLNYEAFDQTNTWATSVKNDLKDFRKNWGKNPEKAAKNLADILSVLQSQLKFEGLVKLCGGIQNIFVRGNYDGFRVGDEKGQHALESETLGQIGSYEPGGPLGLILNKTGIASGELFISWLLNPL